MSAGDKSPETMEGKDPVTTEMYDEYLKHAQSLSLDASTAGLGEKDDTLVKKAKFVTPTDAVLETVGGEHLPAVPVEEAERLNELEAKVHAKEDGQDGPEDQSTLRDSKEQVNVDSTAHDASAPQTSPGAQQSNEPLGSLEPPRTTNPLFPPLPVWGPSSITRNLQCYIFRTTSFFLSTALLTIIFSCGMFTSLIRPKEKEEDRPYYQEEKNRQREREADDEAWYKRKRQMGNATLMEDIEGEATQDSYIPTEGGHDPIVCDVGYYARRVGLDMEEYKVQTEDGFIIDLWHIYNPREYTPKSAEHRAPGDPNVFQNAPSCSTLGGANCDSKRKYPVLMIHGLLQSGGAYCVNDDYSLAFYLAKANYDVWIGNNRCGFHPQHSLLPYGDPRMWNWNIRHMGILDLPAFISRVLYETGFSKLGLIGHSQGTTQTLVALAKSQRPDLGDKISIFCALAPAAYAGPLLDRWYLKFFRTLSPAMYKVVFGIHAFIPFMMTMHNILPPHLYGVMGYKTFSYMFNWSNRNWDRALNDRMFQFAPVYISSEAMRWWLGRDCFAQQGCIISPRDEWMMDDADDETYDNWALSTSVSNPSPLITPNSSDTPSLTLAERKLAARKEKAWYDERSPPMAFWVAGSDELVDGQRLLKRLSRERGREPCVRVVKQKVIDRYEHLDVIWAIDSIDEVGREVKECLWATCPVRDEVMVPSRCDKVEVWRDPGPIRVEEQTDRG